MGKRKKKIKRRRELAISVFGLDGMADHYETTPLYQSRFHEGDMVWLADEYQRRSSSDPSLTLEDFAIQYGVSADELRFYIPELSDGISRSVVLWHGTTRSRAESILSQGFRVKKSSNRKRLIFFARNPKMAQRYARKRAKNEGDGPAVIMCSIDLGYYDNYERRGTEVYALGYEGISSEVVRRVTGLPRKRREKSKKQENASVELTDVALTFNSGCAGIAYWINTYLKLDGQNRIHEDHEAVQKIKQWLDVQISEGRFGAVPDDETLEQVRKYLPKVLQ